MSSSAPVSAWTSAASKSDPALGEPVQDVVDDPVAVVLAPRSSTASSARSGYSANRSRSRQRSALDVAPAGFEELQELGVLVHARGPHGRTVGAGRGGRRPDVHRPFTTRSLAGNRSGTRLLDLPASMLPSTQAGEVIKAGELEIRPSEFLALAGGRALTLSVRELELLAALGRREGRVVPREELYQTVWGVPMRVGRPVGGRVRPQAAGQARERAAGVGVHPHALRVRLPLPAGAFTAFSQGRRRVGNRIAVLSLRASRRHDYGEGRVR